ncbi:Genetic competence transcription factor [Bhargavaea cecembensis DSE10]|uniref:Genetic competence transcription factor n=2 Tax=Bhargavaea cecembensis TaxID=394098 RepID=M7NAH1_9BACL|nr:Genetic competence transcription factor [Bhargavaea cecembensis DSE10]
MDMKRLASPYYISFDTLALEPKVIDGKVCTVVTEKKDKLLLDNRPLNNLKRACEMYGTTLRQAIQISSKLIGNHHKVPVLIVQDMGMPCIFLPTLSPQSENNVWIGLHGIEDYWGDSSSCEVLLENGDTIRVNVSIQTMNRQYALACRLDKKFSRMQYYLRHPGLDREFI